MKVKPYSQNSAPETQNICDLMASHASAMSASKSSLVKAERKSFAVTTAKRSITASLGGMIYKLFARIVGLRIQRISSSRQSIAQKVARTQHGLLLKKGELTLRVLRVESAGRADVYCMRVNEMPAFALASGAIVHNCRYAYMMRRYAIRKADIGRNVEPDYSDYVIPCGVG